MGKKDKAIANCYFDVDILVAGAIGLTGRFASVSGLGIEFKYDEYYEGGSMYPRFMFNYAKPQILTLSEGVVTSPLDFFAWWSWAMNMGMGIPAGNGSVTLRNEKGEALRGWIICGAYLTKYIGPTLDANSPRMAVNSIEMVYGGSF